MPNVFDQFDAPETPNMALSGNVFDQFDKPEPKPGLWQRLKSSVTGEGRTEFPDAQEFFRAYADTRPEDLPDVSAVMQSAITSNPAAAWDIIRKKMPHVEGALDKHGNLMLRAPGMKDWAYLNKPGMSMRDLDEVGTQTLATLPFLGVAGQGATLPMRIASGAGFMGLGEITRQGLEKAAGSEQGGDTERLAFATGLGGALAPGVPSAVVGGVRDAVGAAVAPVTTLARSAMRPGAEADRRVATAYAESQQPVLGQGQYSNLSEGGRRFYSDGSPVPQTAGGRFGAAREPMTPEMLQHRAASELQEKAGQVGEGTYGADTRLMDIGGERMRATARSAANNSPEARETLNRVIQPRFESQGERAEEFIGGLIGGNTAGRSREALQEMAQTARAPFYERAFFDGAGGVQTEVIVRLAESPVMQKAIKAATTAMENRAASGRLQSAISGPRGYTLEFWDQVKRSLDDIEGALSRSGERSAAADAAGIRRQLIDELDRAVPSYAEARGVASGIFRANDALEAGENFATQRFANDQARRGVEAMNPMEQDLFAQGFVARTIAGVREVGDRRNLANQIANSPATRERFEIALGPERTRELEAFLRHENMMDFVRSAVQGNSTTARQLVELGLAGGLGGLASGFNPKDPTGWIVAVLAKLGARRANVAIDTRLANEIAERLVSRDPTVMRRGLQRLAEPRVLQALRAADDALGTLPRNVGIEAAEPSKDDRAKIKPGNAMSTPKAFTDRLPQNAMEAQAPTRSVAPPAVEPSAPNNAMSPDLGPQEGDTATNPETGAKLILRNGQWQRLQ